MLRGGVGMLVGVLVEVAEAALGVGIISAGVVIMYCSRRRQFARTGRGPDASSRYLAVVVVAIIVGAVIVVQFAVHR